MDLPNVKLIFLGGLTACAIISAIVSSILMVTDWVKEKNIRFKRLEPAVESPSKTRTTIKGAAMKNLCAFGFFLILFGSTALLFYWMCSYYDLPTWFERDGARTMFVIWKWVAIAEIVAGALCFFEAGRRKVSGAKDLPEEPINEGHNDKFLSEMALLLLALIGHSTIFFILVLILSHIAWFIVFLVIGIIVAFVIAAS